ncbi:MAG: hydrogenase maturation nickel metallochaperone HypA [Bacteroidales bacterium]|nr:hydrogenase maturation nickel metallochaperone HypA [Bacteroidales bacterium]MBN2762790.1 hydrogenase maturation nickel metallochaperone HypA [Bacteroidales bacterium]
MHEFSIVVNIIDIAESTALEHNANGVSEVEVEVGDASGVSIEALEFAWESAIASSRPLKNTKLKIQNIPLLARCSQCQHQYTATELYEACPFCGAINPVIIQGRELRVKSIVLADQ